MNPIIISKNKDSKNSNTMESNMDTHRVSDVPTITRSSNGIWMEHVLSIYTLCR